MNTRGSSVKPSILAVDDEKNIRDLLSAALSFAGFNVTVAANAKEALAAADANSFDIVLLDIMLPDLSGFNLLPHLRASQPGIPVIFLTARDDMADKIRGLTAGGDDYITKPFGLEEVLARINAVLRRTRTAEEPEQVLRHGPLVINEDLHEVTVADKVLELSPTEYDLLRYLLINTGRVLSKQQILDEVWGIDRAGDPAIVETYISYLRRKLDAAAMHNLIQTRRGVGYLIRAQS